MRHLRLLMALAVMGVVFLVMSGAAAADVMINPSLIPPTIGPQERPVLLVAGDTGTTVHGNIADPSAVVNFSTTNDVLFNGDVNGHPSIRAVDGSINTLVISLPGFTFTDAIFLVYGVYNEHPQMTITVFLNDGGVQQTFNLRSGQTSRNWFNIETFNNETISRIEITNAKFYALQDVDISGAQSTVPEPSTIALVFSGLLGAGQRLRKNRKSRTEVSL